MNTRTDDPKPERTAASTKLSLGTSPGGFSNVVTLVMTLFISGLLFCTTAPSSESPRINGIHGIAETAARVFERDLWVENSIEFVPSELRGVLRPVLESHENAREDAITGFGEVIEHRGYPDSSLAPVDEKVLDTLRAKRIVLLAESNRIEEANGDLSRLTTKGNVSFVDGVQRAYSKVQLDDPRTFADYDVSLAGDEWIGKRLQLRLAVATNDAGARSRLESEIRSRLGVFADRKTRLAMTWGIVTLLGLIVLMVWLARNRPEGPVSSALSPPLWLFENGYAVLVRAAFFGLVILIALEQIGFRLRSDTVTVWGSLIVSIPLLVLLHKRLLGPLGLGFSPTFGLTQLRNPIAWILFTLAIFTVDQLGVKAIGVLTHMAGATSHWSEGVDTTSVWSSKTIAIFEAIDTCVWFPLLAGFAARGLLYLTLRRNYPPWQAALLSAAIFGAVHFYSLPGMMSVTWSGFVYAMAFERCRSLWPSVACHSAACALAFATTWFVYR